MPTWNLEHNRIQWTRSIQILWWCPHSLVAQCRRSIVGGSSLSPRGCNLHQSCREPLMCPCPCCATPSFSKNNIFLGLVLNRQEEVPSLVWNSCQGKGFHHCLLISKCNLHWWSSLFSIHQQNAIFRHLSRPSLWILLVLSKETIYMHLNNFFPIYCCSAMPLFLDLVHSVRVYIVSMFTE